MRHHLGPGFELNPKSSVSECLCDGTFNFEGFFFFTQNPTSKTVDCSRW